MEILGVALAVNDPSTAVAGWSILGVFTGLAVVATLVALVVNIRLTWQSSVDEAKAIADNNAATAAVDNKVSSSANDFVANLENAGAV